MKKIVILFLSILMLTGCGLSNSEQKVYNMLHKIKESNNLNNINLVWAYHDTKYDRVLMKFRNIGYLNEYEILAFSEDEMYVVDALLENASNSFETSKKAAVYWLFLADIQANESNIVKIDVEKINKKISK